jgi:hypothetical protein
VRCEKYVQRTAPELSIATFVRYEMQSWENAVPEEMHPLAVYQCQVVLDTVQGVFEIVQELICEHFIGVTARRQRVVGVKVSDAKDEVRFDMGFCESLLARCVRVFPLQVCDLQLLEARSKVIGDGDCPAKASC